jgi:hypothetical protein
MLLIRHGALPASLLALASILQACGGGQPKAANTEAHAKPREVTAAAPDLAPAETPTPVMRSSAPMEVKVRFHQDMADGTHATEFQSSRLVGHYSTPNGKVGFILDRTSDPPKIKMDGDAYTLVLAPRQASKGWLEFVASNIWIRIDEQTGRILSFTGPGMTDSTFVVRDADAKALSTPR